MITAEGPVAKLVLFVVEKCGSKLIALAVDKRRKACRVLTKLYYCLQRLDEVTDQVFEEFSIAGQYGAEFSAGDVVEALDMLSCDIEQASNKFIELSDEIYDGLLIIDPELAKCCGILARGKFDFLYAMSQVVIVERSVPTQPTLVIKVASDRLAQIDWDRAYQQYQLHKGDDLYHWPEAAFEFDTDVHAVRIAWDDLKEAQALRDRVSDQSRLLKTAKEKLRDLIKANFSVEEVLFQSDTHPYR